MSTANLNIRTDAEVKAEAESLFNELGLNLSTAVNMFLRQAIRVGGIPFEVRVSTPSEVTAAAIAEGKALIKDSNIKGYNSIKDLRAALDV